jgi:hypothetical protein
LAAHVDHILDEIARHVLDAVFPKSIRAWDYADAAYV